MQLNQERLTQDKILKFFPPVKLLKRLTSLLTFEQRYDNKHLHLLSVYTKFKNYIDEHSNYSEEEIALFFNISLSTLSDALNKIGYSRKKVKLTKKEMNKNKKNIQLL